MTRPRILVASIILAIAGTGASGQETISLRPDAQVRPGRPVLLRDVADIAGPGAEALGAIEVGGALAPGAAASVQVASLRDLLRTSPGVNPGRILLSGGTCAISAQAPMTKAPAAGSPAPPRPGAPASGPTLRDRIADRIAQTLNLPPEDLRLSFEESQAELLATPVAGRSAAVQPTGSGERISVQTRVYEGDTIVASGSVRVGVQVRRTVLVARTTLARGAVLGDADVVQEERWLPPAVLPAPREDAIGSVLRARVEPGTVIEDRFVEAPLVVRRGEVVTVDCVCGSVVVRAPARAMESGHDADIVQFQPLNSKKTFRARMNGPGRAVMVTPADEPATPTENP